MKSIREYKTPTIFSMVFIVLECLIEIFIPFVTRNLINDIDAGIFDNIYRYGLILVILALCSLTCGVLAGRFCAKESVGFAKNFLVEGQMVKIKFFESEILGIDLPDKIELEVTETTGAVAGNTATNATKDATVETGLLVRVPLFVKEGDKIIVSTDDGKYCGRA